MPNNRTKIGEYDGLVVYFNPLTKRFEVGGEDFGYEAFASFDEATAAIDKKKRVKQKIKHENVNLDVLKHDGSATVTIKGIHQRHGTLLFTDGEYSKLASEGYSNVSAVYPVASWITDLLHERNAISTRLTEIDRALRKVQIKVRRSYGNIKNPERYDVEVKSLRDDHARATDLAKQHKQSA